MKRQRMVISSDKRLNPRLAEQVSTLRGTMVGALENQKLPEWLDMHPHEHLPAMVFTDLRSGRSVTLGLCDAHGGIGIIKGLFG